MSQNLGFNINPPSPTVISLSADHQDGAGFREAFDGFGANGVFVFRSSGRQGRRLRAEDLGAC